MNRGQEFAVQVKRWPAYVLAVLIPVQVVLYSVAFVLLGRAFWTLDVNPLGWAGFAVAMLGSVFVVGATVRSARRAFQMIRHPPLLTVHGMWLWLFPTAEYVLIPWPRVVMVRTGTSGLARGLFVHVHDPEGLAGEDPSAARKLRRMLRRFHGAPFAYDLAFSSERPRELDRAVRWFTGDGLTLR